MCSPSTAPKVNYLYIRHLRFRSVRGDLQEGYFALPEANFLSSRCQSLSFRAQNRHFCALLGSGTPVFGCFEHKIEVFVLFCPSELSFSGFLSTESGFLCSRGGESGIVKRNREDAFHFAAAPTPSHKSTSRTRTVLGRLGAALVPSQSRYGTVLD